MTSLCLHKVKKVCKVDYASKDESNQKTCFNQFALLNIIKINEKTRI